jgi:hypothetical protein
MAAYDEYGIESDNVDPEKTKDIKGTLDAILHGAGRGVSFGFSDELQGLAGALGAKSVGDKRSFGDVYRSARDEARVEEAKRSKDHPVAYKTSEILSSLLVPVPGAGALNTVAAKAIPHAAPLMFKPAAWAASEGLQRGALAGLGESTADVTKGEVGDAALDAGKSAVLTALLSSAPTAVPTIAKAGQSAVRSIAKNMPAVSKSLVSPLAGGAAGMALSHGDPTIGMLGALLSPVVHGAVKATGKAIIPKIEKLANKAVAGAPEWAIDRVIASGDAPHIASTIAQQLAGKDDAITSADTENKRVAEAEKLLPKEEVVTEKQMKPEDYLPKE